MSIIPWYLGVKLSKNPFRCHRPKGQQSHFIQINAGGSESVNRTCLTTFKYWAWSWTQRTKTWGSTIFPALKKLANWQEIWTLNKFSLIINYKMQNSVKGSIGQSGISRFHSSNICWEVTSPEMTPYSYGPLIWGKGAKIMQLRKNNLYIKWCWDNGISHANENGSSLSPGPKRNSKCIIDLNVRAKL